ncbi:ATP-binding protein, partial [Chloroflexota bacterium]
NACSLSKNERSRMGNQNYLLLDSLVDVIHGSTRLQMEYSRTVVYWTIATYLLERFRWFPMLVFQGPPGTGKSTLLGLIGNLCREPRFISGKGITGPALRDELGQCFCGTAILEEADESHDQKRVESFLGARCDRNTSKFIVKRPAGRHGWVQQPIDIYGATALHTRQPFLDQAVQSRSIVIPTQFAYGPFTTPKFDPDPQPLIRVILPNPDPNYTLATGCNIAGRIVDIWRPLLVVAEHLEDREWLKWAEDQMRDAQEELEDGHGYEPSAVVLGRVIELLVTGNPSKISEQDMRRVKIDEEIGSFIRKNYLPFLTPWQVSRTLKNLGLEVQRSGGINWLLPTADAIRKAAKKIGYEDDALN